MEHWSSKIFGPEILDAIALFEMFFEQTIPLTIQLSLRSPPSIFFICK